MLDALMALLSAHGVALVEPLTPHGGQASPRRLAKHAVPLGRGYQHRRAASLLARYSSARRAIKAFWYFAASRRPVCSASD